MIAVTIIFLTILFILGSICPLLITDDMRGIIMLRK